MKLLCSMELLTGGVFAQVKFVRACSEYYSRRSQRRVDGIRKYIFEKRIVRFFFFFSSENHTNTYRERYLKNKKKKREMKSLSDEYRSLNESMRSRYRFKVF